MNTQTSTYTFYTYVVDFEDVGEHMTSLQLEPDEHVWTQNDGDVMRLFVSNYGSAQLFQDQLMDMFFAAYELEDIDKVQFEVVPATVRQV